MIIGVDLDNTIINYGSLFYDEAIKRKLIPANILKSKQAVGDFLRSSGKEADFTYLQGHVYGPGLEKAEAYDGALQTLAKQAANGSKVYIISHKTKYPYAGGSYNLHDYAMAWLKRKGFAEIAGIEIFLEPDMPSKLQRIAEKKCNVFIDDLQKCLCRHDFPESALKVLFAPDYCLNKPKNVKICASWTEIGLYLDNLQKSIKNADGLAINAAS